MEDLEKTVFERLEIVVPFYFRYADHDFDWNNVEILHSESNKGKREFMEMLYIYKERQHIL